jgi:hypothetical protein
MTITEDKINRLTEAVGRIDRIFNKEAQKITAREIFDPSTTDRDLEIAREVIEGYSEASPQERDQAYFRNAVRSLLYDPQIQQAAHKHGIPPEELASKLIEKGMQGINFHGGKKKEEFVLETVGREKGVDPRKAAQSRRLREIADQGVGSDDDLTAQIKTLFPDDDSFFKY